VNKASDSVVKFKAVSEAFEVLTDDAKRAIAEAEGHASPGSGRGRGGNSYHGWERTAAEKARREQARALFRTLSWFELLIHPKMLLILVPSIFFVTWVLSPNTIVRRDAEVDVPAWFNKRSNRWETPAPWDKTFQVQNPEVTLVSRKSVHPFTGGREQ
jgi:curved DNA-binding protein CbpA